MTKDIDQKTGLTNGRSCNRCNEWKPNERFGTRKNRKGVRIPLLHCKDCEAERTRKRRENPEELEKHRVRNRQYMAEKRKNNPEWVKQKNEANRIYAAKQREDPDHRESVNMYRRVLWAINEEYKKKTNDRVREWINENRDRWRAKLSLRRYREAGAEGEFTDEDIELIHGSQQFQCVYCGVDTSEIYHVDHITPIARGGSSWPSNLQILCPSCNCSKRDKTHEEYLAYRSNLQMAISEAAE